jgi:hypothetical protein
MCDLLIIAYSTYCFVDYAAGVGTVAVALLGCRECHLPAHHRQIWAGGQEVYRSGRAFRWATRRAGNQGYDQSRAFSSLSGAGLHGDHDSCRIATVLPPYPIPRHIRYRYVGIPAVSVIRSLRESIVFRVPTSSAKSLSYSKEVDLLLQHSLSHLCSLGLKSVQSAAELRSVGFDTNTTGDSCSNQLAQRLICSRKVGNILHRHKIKGCLLERSKYLLQMLLEKVHVQVIKQPLL